MWMGTIRNIIIQHINDLDETKTGLWNRPEVPPENKFTKSELYKLGDCIASDLEGMFSDMMIHPMWLADR